MGRKKKRQKTCKSRWMLVRPVPLPHGGFMLLKVNFIFTQGKKIIQYPKFSMI